MSPSVEKMEVNVVHGRNYVKQNGLGEYEVHYSSRNDSDSDIADWLLSKVSKSNKTSFYDTYASSTTKATSKKNRKNQEVFMISMVGSEKKTKKKVTMDVYPETGSQNEQTSQVQPYLTSLKQTIGSHPSIQTYPRHKSPFIQDTTEMTQRWDVNEDKYFTLGSHLSVDTLVSLQDVLRRYQHVFAWSYRD